jgi:hypothetical protein
MADVGVEVAQGAGAADADAVGRVGEEEAARADRLAGGEGAHGE